MPNVLIKTTEYNLKIDATIQKFILKNADKNGT